MLSRKGVIIRYILCLCFYLLSGTGLVTGWLAAISGVLGTIELATALLRYSPVYDLMAFLDIKFEPSKFWANKLELYRLSHLFNMTK
ncbi:MAG: YgaP-like transmembrane domain [Syntrophomonas sp.]